MILVGTVLEDMMSVFMRLLLPQSGGKEYMKVTLPDPRIFYQVLREPKQHHPLLLQRPNLTKAIKSQTPSERLATTNQPQMDD